MDPSPIHPRLLKLTDSTKREEIGNEGRITGPTQTRDAGQWEERQTDKQRARARERERGGGGGGFSVKGGFRVHRLTSGTRMTTADVRKSSPTHIQTNSVINII